MLHSYKVKHEENFSTFTVRNTSHIPAVCTVCLLHGRNKYFDFQPANFTVQVNSSSHGAINTGKKSNY